MNTAEWVVTGNTTLHYSCSICGQAGDIWDNFCRNCGKQMINASTKKSDVQQFIDEQMEDPEFKAAFESLKFTPEEVVALVEKIEPTIKPDGYFVGMAYNDATGLAHIIIDKEGNIDE